MKNWFILEYVKRSFRSKEQIVLHTSNASLRELANELLRISDENKTGSNEIKIVGMDKDYELPFTHVNFLRSPQEHQPSSHDYFVLMIIIAFILIVLALYGAYSFVMSAIS